MATALNNAAENAMETMETDDIQPEDTDGLNIDSFIDEEFTNLFDSGSDGEESLFAEDHVTRSSSSSLIFAQQLKKLNESTNGEISLITRGEGENISLAKNEDLDDGSKARQQFCENCQRLQQASTSIDVEESIHTTGETFLHVLCSYTE